METLTRQEAWEDLSFSIYIKRATKTLKEEGVKDWSEAIEWGFSNSISIKHLAREWELCKADTEETQNTIDSAREALQ